VCVCVCVCGGGGGPSVYAFKLALKNWPCVSWIYLAQRKVGVTGCCEHGNEHMGWENFLIIFGTITFSREIVP
jgi:hypothetical protein